MKRFFVFLILEWAVLVAANAAPITVTDYSGHEVTLQRPAQRIVALTPHLVENLFTAGLGSRIVGAVAFSNYPKAARTIPRVGGADGLSLEAIVAKHPDLVVAWRASITDTLVHRLRAMGIAVYMDNPRTPADIARSIRDFGRLGGTEKQADKAAAVFMQEIDGLRRHYGEGKPVSLFYEVWPDPLQTIAGDTLIGSVIRLCGGRNIFADEKLAAPKVSIEAVIARDPQVIVVADSHARQWRAGWQRWSAINAVAHDQFVTVPADLISRPTVRIAKGAKDLCVGLDRAR